MFKSTRLAQTAGWFLILAAAGCMSPQERQRQRLDHLVDTRLAAALGANLTAIGGLDAWQRLGSLEAQALTTLESPPSGDAFVEQCYILTYGESSALTAITKEAKFLSREMLLANGSFKIEIDRQAVTDPVLQSGGAVKLRLVLQALTGSAGLLGKKYNLVYQGQQRQAGKVMHKIELSAYLVPPVYPLPATGKDKWQRPMDRLVLWIDTQKNLVERLWLAYPLDPQAGQYGYLAANVRDYKKLDSGITVPTTLEVVPGDRFQQFSQRKIMTITLLKIDAAAAVK